MKAPVQSRQSRRAHTIVETAFVLLICLMGTFAIYEYSRYYMMAQMVNNAAREGARLAVATTNTQNTSAVQSTVMQYLSGLGLSNSAGNPLSASDVVVQQVNPATGVATSPDSNWYDAAFGSSIKVSVTAKFTPLFSGFGFTPATITVIGTSVMSSEAN